MAPPCGNLLSRRSETPVDVVVAILVVVPLPSPTLGSIKNMCFALVKQNLRESVSQSRGEMNSDEARCVGRKRRARLGRINGARRVRHALLDG